MPIWEIQYYVIQNGDEKMNDRYVERKVSAGMHRTRAHYNTGTPTD